MATYRVYFEGVAIYLGEQSWHRESGLWSDLAIEPLIAPDFADFTTDQYMVAGRFVAFLVATFGPQIVPELMRGTAPWDSSERGRDALETVTGEAFDQLVERFINDEACNAGEWQNFVFECAAAPVPWRAGQWQWSSSLDCSDPEVFGSEPGVRVQQALIEIPVAGRYEIFTAGPGANFSLVACAMCQPGLNLYWNGPRQGEITLAAGLYIVTLSSDGPRPGGRAGVRIVPSLVDPSLVDASRGGGPVVSAIETGNKAR